MEVLIISDQEIGGQENLSVKELLMNVDYVIETNFSRIQSQIRMHSYKLLVFLTSKQAYPASWNFNELRNKAAVITITKVDKLDFVIFSSFLKSLGLWSGTLNSEKNKDDLPPILYQSLIYIEENIHENDLSLAKVAASVYISRCHYSRIFKTFFGTGFKEYVINKRIQNAKLLLQKGSSVTDTCYAVGYGDLTHFGRMFHKMVGMTPSEYRRKYHIKAEAN